MPAIGRQSLAASDSVADIGDSADTVSLSSLPDSLPPVVQGFHNNGACHTATGHHQRSSLQTPTSVTLARSVNPSFDGMKAKSHGRGRSTAVSNRAALRRRH